MTFCFKVYGASYLHNLVEPLVAWSLSPEISALQFEVCCLGVSVVCLCCLVCAVVNVSAHSSGTCFSLQSVKIFYKIRIELLVFRPA